MITRAAAVTSARLSERRDGRDGVDDREVDHVRQRPVEQLLAVEAEDRPGQAADAQQQGALEQDRPPQLRAREALELELGQAGAALPDHVADRRRHRQHRDDQDQRGDLRQALQGPGG